MFCLLMLLLLLLLQLVVLLPQAKFPCHWGSAVVPGRPCSPSRHWYQDPLTGYSRTLPWRPGGAHRGAGTTAVARTLGRLRRPTAELATGNGTGRPLYTQCNGHTRRMTASKPDGRLHSTDKLDTTWVTCETDDDDERMAGRFSWSLACLQDLENANESTAAVKPSDRDAGVRGPLSELINPSSTTAPPAPEYS